MTATRPFLLTGAALVSAAALTVAAPAALPGVPTPLQLSTAQYELAALSDLSIQGALDAFTTGWGGFIGPADPFYPGEFANDVLLSGINGVAYYLVDQALDGIDPLNLENYFFEVGSRSPGNETIAGLGAAAYVGVGSVFGADSVPAQFVKTLLGGGSVDLGTAIVTLTAGIPVVGDLTSVYFTGQVAGGTTTYGTGLAGVLAYVGTLFPALSGVDFSGLVTGVAGLIGTIGDLISGGGSGNGNGGSHHDESDDSASTDSTDTEDTDTEDTEDADTEDSDVEESHGNGHGNQNGNLVRSGDRVASGAAVLPKAAAAALTAPKADAASAPAEAPEVTASVAAGDAAEPAESAPAAKQDAGRGGSARDAGKAHADGGRGSNAKAARNAAA